MPKVAYLGPPGTFGEQVALSLTGTELLPLSTHTLIVKAVDEGGADYGIVAIENSLDGPITETIDALLKYRRVQVVGERIVPVEHCLIAAPDAGEESIRVVKSHTTALAQCRQFIDALDERMWHAQKRHIERVTAFSTADAVREAVHEPHVAAIGTRRAAEVYGGRILAAGIQDVANNQTRFLVLQRHNVDEGNPTAPTGADKTSIAFEVPDRPGSLVEVLREFSSRSINLTRIESRPSREELGRYVFLIDFEGHRLDAGPKEALAAIAKAGARLLPWGRPLGSYPRAQASLRQS